MTRETCNLTPGNNPQKTRHAAGGIARPLSLAEDFADDDAVAIITGDNIFQNSVKDAIQSFRSGAHIFLKSVLDTARLGVTEVDESSGWVPGIEEKPEVPKSNYAVTRLYRRNERQFFKPDNQ